MTESGGQQWDVELLVPHCFVRTPESHMILFESIQNPFNPLSKDTYLCLVHFCSENMEPELKEVLQVVKPTQAFIN